MLVGKMFISDIYHTSLSIAYSRTRKPSCSWQTRATLEIRFTGYSTASKVTPFDSLHYGFLLPSYSNFVSKMHRFRDLATYWSKIAEKPTPLSFGTFVRVTLCKFFDESYLAREWNHGAITWFRPTSHDPAFALLDAIPAVTDGRTDGRTGTLLSQKPHSA